MIEHDKQPEEQSEAPAKIRKFYSSPGIDYTSCRYNSKFIVVLLWTGFVISYIAYFGPLIRERPPTFLRVSAMAPLSILAAGLPLPLLNGSLFLAFFADSVLAYVALGSIGNGIEDTKKWTRIFAIMSIALWTYLFFFDFYAQEDRNLELLSTMMKMGTLLLRILSRKKVNHTKL